MTTDYPQSRNNTTQKPTSNTMKNLKKSEILKLTVRIESDFYGNPRYFIPADALPIEPGSEAARELGLTKSRSKKRDPGFVFKSYNVKDRVGSIVDALYPHQDRSYASDNDALEGMNKLANQVYGVISEIEKQPDAELEAALNGLFEAADCLARLTSELLEA